MSPLLYNTTIKWLVFFIDSKSRHTLLKMKWEFCIYLLSSEWALAPAPAVLNAPKNIAPRRH